MPSRHCALIVTLVWIASWTRAYGMRARLDDIDLEDGLLEETNTSAAKDLAKGIIPAKACERLNTFGDLSTDDEGSQSSLHVLCDTANLLVRVTVEHGGEESAYQATLEAGKTLVGITNPPPAYFRVQLVHDDSSPPWAPNIIGGNQQLDALTLGAYLEPAETGDGLWIKVSESLSLFFQ